MGSPLPSFEPLTCATLWVCSFMWSSSGTTALRAFVFILLLSLPTRESTRCVKRWMERSRSSLHSWEGGQDTMSENSSTGFPEAENIPQGIEEGRRRWFERPHIIEERQEPL